MLVKVVNGLDICASPGKEGRQFVIGRLGLSMWTLREETLWLAHQQTGSR